VGSVGFVEGVTDKRYMCVPAGCCCVGANRVWGEFAASFVEWEVGNKGSLEESVEIEVCLAVVEEQEGRHWGIV